MHPIHRSQQEMPMSRVQRERKENETASFLNVDIATTFNARETTIYIPTVFRAI